MRYFSYILCFIILGNFCAGGHAKEGPTIYCTLEISGQDTICNFILPEVIVFSPLKFKNKKERLEYTKLVRDVKIALPYAKMVSRSITESYEMMMTLKTKKERQKFLEDVQSDIMKTYKPKMKKMTKNQGRVLVKLIDRETNSSSYDIVKSLLGSFKAGLYNTFAQLFGNNLKTRYEPDGKDWMIERIVVEIEQGNI